jgi:hypothetical protein
VYELGPGEPALRVPYEMLMPVGPVRRHDQQIQWLEGESVRTGRYASTHLGHCHPGERVLLRLWPAPVEDDWWLCEVEAVDGVAEA